jgi:hypothetical protein
VGACESLTEINQNPNTPTDVPADMLLPSAIRVAVENAYGSGQYLSLTALWPQHGVQIQFAWEEIGLVHAGWMEGPWGAYYTGPLMDIQAVIDKGIKAEDKNVEAVGLIWKAWVTHIITDSWGDVPYSEALEQYDEEGALIMTPVYDTQQSIYTAMPSGDPIAYQKLLPSASQ